jgi:transcriptional regulator with XRE-family HTH domain
MNFGNALKTLRLLKNLRQKEAAALLHMEERSLRRIESNKTRISAEQLAQFAEIYEVDIAYIFKLAQEATPFVTILKDSPKT